MSFTLPTSTHPPPAGLRLAGDSALLRAFVTLGSFCWESITSACLDVVLVWTVRAMIDVVFDVLCVVFVVAACR